MSEMSCQAARDLMLEADLAELNGVGDLAGHIDTCERCRQITNMIVSSYHELDAGLSGLRSEPRRARRWKRASWLSVPLAAAAVLTILLARPEPLPPPTSPLLLRLMFPPRPVVTPSPGTQAMVIQQTDATIVWLY